MRMSPWFLQNETLFSVVFCQLTIWHSHLKLTISFYLLIWLWSRIETHCICAPYKNEMYPAVSLFWRKSYQTWIKNRIRLIKMQTAYLLFQLYQTGFTDIFLALQKQPSTVMVLDCYYNKFYVRKFWYNFMNVLLTARHNRKMDGFFVTRYFKTNGFANAP